MYLTTDKLAVNMSCVTEFDCESSEITMIMFVTVIMFVFHVH